MTSVVFGTAGHIDHGKTTLVRAITGQDTDRLPEEKSRGISIELGFAHFQLPSGRVAALVDVPGHERFIRNMVAGVHGMDAAILVVAADEGVMPQTLEHLDILQLLGVSSGITVLSKADTVEADWLNLVEETTREALSDTFLGQAPLVITDAVSGRGLDELRRALDHLAEEALPRSVDGFAKLPVDRVFSVHGFGTVVTGTLVSGALVPEQMVVLQPSGTSARVRGLEVHNHPVHRAVAGQRVAVNLSAIDHIPPQRGQVLTVSGAMQPATVLTVDLMLLQKSPPLEMNARVHCHIGTAETVARIYLFDRMQVNGGERTFAELRLDQPLAASRGDRFLIRWPSPLDTIGGGNVIELGIHHHRKESGLIARLERMSQPDLCAWALALLNESPQPLSLDELSRSSGLPGSVIAAELDRGDFLHDEQRGWWWSRIPFERMRDQVIALVGRHHAQFPLRPGIGREELRQKVADTWPVKSFWWIMECISAVRLEREWVALKDFSPVLEPAWSQAAITLYQAIDQSRLNPDGKDWLMQHWQGPPHLLPEILHWMVRQGCLLRLDDEVYISQRTYDWARQVVVQSIGLGISSTSELKERLSSNRRYTISFLELLDSQHVTRRAGDGRVLRSEVIFPDESPRTKS
ncbi:MAG: selenocysteine-specific translation elongation factor [Firmicutes bacterium]|jgi:selenocysteine-specific elongation factor|nr:selenocysteine-specific translation elongation factor [Bacillota bacterium]